MGEKSSTFDDAQLLCVDSETALQLLHRRPTIKSRPVCVNVFSTVLAVSEIIQIKDSQLFLVKLLPKLDIIFKQKEILHLNDSIIPQKSYIFTNLRHTTLQKGSSCPCLVYTVTKETRILQEPSENVKIMTCSEWLKKHELKDDAVSPEMKIEEPFFSYAGTITKILDARLGVYELDREVRLYIGHIPAVHKYRYLTAGMEIFVHNAHHQISKQKPKVTIYGCMLTSVRVIKYPDSRSEVPAIQKMQLLDKYLYLYQLSQEKLQRLYHICQTVQEKFAHLGRRICDKLITQILLNPALSWKQECKRDYRNHLDEFLQHPHNCCFQHQTNQTFPQFAAFEELFKNKVVAAQSDNLWQYTHDYNDKDQVLLGELDVCQKTGLSVLRDSTGHCNTVITHYSNTLTQRTNKHEQKTRHECDPQCDCHQLEPGQVFPCPCLHTCCIGKLVAVIKYSVVCESVSTSICQGLVNKQGPYSMNYVMFSLTDAVYLGKREARTFHTRNKMDNRSEKCTEIKPVQSSDVTAKPFGSTKLQNQEKCVKDGAAGVDIDHVGSHMTNSSQSQRLALHRHTRQDGGVYFCRKAGCVNDMIDRETSNDDEDVVIDIHRKKTCRKGNPPLSKLPDTLGNVSLKSVTQTSLLKGTCSKSNHKENILDIPIKKKRLSKRNTSDDQTHLEEEEINHHGKSKASGSERYNAVSVSNGKKDVAGCQEDLEFSDASYEIGLETATIVIHRKDALVIEENNGNQTARFCVHGQIVKEDNTSTQVVLMFKGKSAGWYSVIHAGSTYQFSITTELSPLFKNNVANIKVTEKLEKQNRQMFMVVNELADIHQIYQHCTNNNNSFSAVCPEEPITSV